MDGEIDATIILEDPSGNSYIQVWLAYAVCHIHISRGTAHYFTQDLYAPDPDPYLERSYFERTEEQNEELGLSDMHVEGYEGQQEEKEKKEEQEEHHKELWQERAIEREGERERERERERVLLLYD